MRSRNLTLLLVLPCVAGLIGCTGDPQTAKATRPSRVESSSADPSPTGGRIEVDRELSFVLDVAEATPVQFKEPAARVRLKADSADRMLAPGGISAEKDLLVEESSLRSLDGAGHTLNTFSRVGLWSQTKGFVPAAKTGREARGVLKGAERQSDGMKRVGDRLVWMETPSTDLMFQEWSLRTAETDGSGVRELAHSQPLKPPARPLPVFGGTDPVVIGDWVYWAATVATTLTPDPAAEKDWEFNILRTKLSGRSKVETVAKNSVLPAAAGGDLVYVTRTPGASKGYEIRRRAVSDGGTEKTIVRGIPYGETEIVDLVASDSYVAWGVSAPKVGEAGWSSKSEPGQIFVLDLATHEVGTVIAADEVAGQRNLSLTRTGVLWGNGSGNGDPTEYYLNMSTRKLHSIAEQRGYSVVKGDPAHDTIIWAKGTNKQTQRMLWHMAELSTPE
ncbi:hypothetical protein LWF15_20030 [Kineosporia rhizophila]|uniref:hypothetical protein n=1 Tax=Kineosporia rhizophila TaxID=84633 RepID=UPI001E5EC40E|nr:hypothetical protein [Kineosporia rhizophila]MCE0537786.1 hypothetical protein [Kineosporia rhizophila]